jgi:hypothetical protein
MSPLDAITTPGCSPSGVLRVLDPRKNLVGP